jgi:NADH-quinone oxidoreductase subunit I
MEQKIDGRAKIKRRSNLNLLERLYLPEIFKGLTITFRQIFKPKFTFEYPDVKWKPPSSFRGRPVLVYNDETGVERCVACGLCARVCPALAIEVVAGETELDKERYPKKFEINMLRCIFCGLCEEVCPEEAIVMSDEYELVFTNREEAIFGKDTLLVPASKLKERLDFLKKMR